MWEGKARRGEWSVTYDIGNFLGCTQTVVVRMNRPNCGTPSKGHVGLTESAEELGRFHGVPAVA